MVAAKRTASEAEAAAEVETATGAVAAETAVAAQKARKLLRALQVRTSPDLVDATAGFALIKAMNFARFHRSTFFGFACLGAIVSLAGCASSPQDEAAREAEKRYERLRGTLEAPGIHTRARDPLPDPRERERTLRQAGDDQAEADTEFRTPARVAPMDDWSWSPQAADRDAGPARIVVSLPSQKLVVYRDGEPIAHSRVSTGKPGHATPAGSFTVSQKERRHRSNRYGTFVDESTGQPVGVGRSDNTPPPGTRFEGARMPYMLRLTDDGICIHEGNVLGYPASAGCIRVPPDFASKLYAVADSGTQVIVTDRML
jgi:lipoprotein-anchoring transpeptidase ErfK/SrfK